jgi:hypothetical protein
MNDHFSAMKLTISRPNKPTLDCPATIMMDEF